MKSLEDPQRGAGAFGAKVNFLEIMICRALWATFVEALKAQKRKSRRCCYTSEGCFPLLCGPGHFLTPGGLRGVGNVLHAAETCGSQPGTVEITESAKLQNLPPPPPPPPPTSLPLAPPTGNPRNIRSFQGISGFPKEISGSPRVSQDSWKSSRISQDS